MSTGDRFLLQYYLGAEQVATYSVGYNLASYAQSLHCSAAKLSSNPNLYETLGSKWRKRRSRFFVQISALFCMMAIPIIFGLVAVGRETIILLASSKYENSSEIIPYVITGIMLSGAYFPMLAGLFLYKKTKIIAYLIIVAAVLNVALNVMLIPVYGINGAAQSQHW